MAVPHPIPYQGSKRRLARVILRYFPEDADRLIEPFAGSAAVTLAAAHSGKARNFLLNDINNALMTLWQELINRPSDLATAYSELWHEQLGRKREFYDEVRDRFNRDHRPDDFLYLLARCVKASVRYNSDGGFNQSPDNRRKGRRPEAMTRDILAASRLLAGRSEVRSEDYGTTLARANPRDIVYMDPPYQGVCDGNDGRYLSGISFDPFVGVLEDANESRLSYIISYDGRTGDREFGKPLPDHLRLEHILVDAGRSTQATLLGRDEKTIESLYLSPALVDRLGRVPEPEVAQFQMAMAGLE